MSAVENKSPRGSKGNKNLRYLRHLRLKNKSSAVQKPRCKECNPPLKFYQKAKRKLTKKQSENLPNGKIQIDFFGGFP